ncbi:hypothetical protein [Caulobacter sp. 1776]
MSAPREIKLGGVALGGLCCFSIGFTFGVLGYLGFGLFGWLP